MTRLLIALISVGMLTTATFGQDDPPATGEKGAEKATLPEFGFKTKSTTVSVPDGGMVVIGGRIRLHKDGRVLPKEIAATPLFEQYSKTQFNDRMEYDVIANKLPIKFKVYDDGKVSMTRTRRYTQDNVEQLKADFPGLSMHVTALPKSDNGGTITGFSFDLEQTIEAANPAEFQEKDSEAYELLQAIARQRLIHVTKEVQIVEEDE